MNYSHYSKGIGSIVFIAATIKLIMGPFNHHTNINAARLMRGFNNAGRAGVSGIVLGLGAALLSLAPYVSLLEEKIGLGLLFALRGARNPPAEVVIVDIDRESASVLSASSNPEQWPHRLHANLIRHLHAAGAELVGFNIFFSSAQPQDDNDMAAAMRETHSVVLANYLRLKPLQGDVYVEALEEPPLALVQSALITAPFLLAQGEEADRFLSRFGDSGDHPTFPLALFRLFVIRQLGAQLDGLMQENNPAPAEPAAYPADTAAFFSELAGRFARQPEFRDRLLGRLHELPLAPGQQASLRTLVETLAGENTRYFNHYGAAGAISRIPYHRLLVSPAAELAKLPLRGKIVLVGFDEDFQSDKSENLFFSPFSVVSSLELAATAVANLLDHSDIRPLFGRWGQFGWLLFWGGLLGLLSTKRLLVGASGIAALSLGYFATACWLFSAHWLWLPVLLPLFWLGPLGMLACLFNNYLTRSRENQKIHSVISRFIPEEAAGRSENPANGHLWESKLSFGVCLATDAGQYTALAEKMKPMDLGELMNDYYAALFSPVRHNGGWVSDVTGDAMMAIWTVPTTQLDIRVGALRAALEILRAVDAFEAKTQVRLPIRMGLHCGEMRVGFVGGREHGAYRAVGDTVNTSARLEGLNKLLGTRILVSEPLISDLPGFLTRPMGRFLLAGKSRPVAVHELVAPAEASLPEWADRIARFAKALALFQAAEWKTAAGLFEGLADEFPEDGPALFYCETARANACNPLATPDLASIPVSKPPPGALVGR